MPAFYLTLIAALLAGIGGRDQATIAAITRKQGQRPAVLVTGMATAVLCAVLAAYAAMLMIAYLPPPARTIFAALALGLAGGEALLAGPVRQPGEPTHSLGALGFVLAFHQISDAARFVIFGLGVGLGSPLSAGAGGGLAGALLVSFAWARADLVSHPAMRRVRQFTGALLSLTCITIVLREFSIL